MYDNEQELRKKLDNLFDLKKFQENYNFFLLLFKHVLGIYDFFTTFLCLFAYA